MSNETEFEVWQRFDECFDDSDGGALYVRAPHDGDVESAGVLWMDGGQDELHYFAFVAAYPVGADIGDFGEIKDCYDAGEAFSEATDPFVSEEIGWFATMDEAVTAVEDAVSTYLAY